LRLSYNLFVVGIPKAQPRPRMTKTGHVYTPDSAKDWKESIAAECISHRQPVIEQPVKLTVCFYLPVPKSANLKNVFYYPHTVKPDADNLLKAVMDAMTEASVWADDALVYSSCAEKWYCLGKCGARIIVEVIEQPGKVSILDFNRRKR